MTSAQELIQQDPRWGWILQNTAEGRDYLNNPSIKSWFQLMGEGQSYGLVERNDSIADKAGSALGNIVPGALLGGMVGGATGSELVGSQVTGNEANLGGAAAFDLAGLAAAPGAASLGLGTTTAVGAGGAAAGAGGIYEYLDTVPGTEESFVGPPTGSVETAPVIGGSGVPTVSATATGSGPFIPTWEGLKDSFGRASALKGLAGLGGGGSTGSNIVNQIMGSPGQAAFNSLPFLLALYQSEQQKDDINDPLGRLRSIESSINGPGFMDAVTRPWDMQTASGRTDMTNSLSNRGVLGSSFGQMDLNNYDYIRGVGRGDLASKALLTSAGVGGDLIGKEFDAINKRNLNTNMLLGAGLGASGSLFQPQKDPFGLENLLALGGIK
jgi:hypothetical protein